MPEPVANKQTDLSLPDNVTFGPISQTDTPVLDLTTGSGNKALPDSVVFSPAPSAAQEAANPFNLSAVWNEQAKPILKYAAEATGVGVQELKDNFTWNMVADGLKHPHDAEAEIQANADNLAKMQSDIAGYEEHQPWLKMATPLLEYAPTLAGGLSAGFALSQVTARAGALTGAGVGAAAAAPTLEGAAPVTVPAGAAAGAAIAGAGGFAAGMFAFTASAARGRSYRYFLRKGLTHDQARIAAIAPAAVDGVLSTIGGRAMTAEARVALQARLAAGGYPASIKHAIGSFLKSSGFNWTLMQIDTFTKKVIDAAVGQLTQIKDIAPTWEQMHDQMAESIVNGVPAATLMALIAHGGGAMVGVAAKPFMKRENTPEQAIDDFVAIQKKNPYKVEKSPILQGYIEEHEAAQPPPEPTTTPRERAESANSTYEAAKDRVKAAEAAVDDLEAELREAADNGGDTLGIEYDLKDADREVWAARDAKRKAYKAKVQADEDALMDTIEDIRQKINDRLSETVIPSPNRNHFRDWTTPRSIKKNQKMLVGIIEKSGAPNDIKGQFLKVIPNVQTAPQLVEAVDSVVARIQKKMEAQKLADNLADLDLQLEASRPTGSGKDVRSKFSSNSDFQHILDIFRFFVEHPEQAQKAESTYETQVNQGRLPLDGRIKYEIAKIVGDVSKKDSKAIGELADTVRDLRKKGLSEKLAEHEARKTKFLAAKGLMIRTVQGKRPVAVDPAGNHHKNPFLYFCHAARMGTVSHPGKISIIAQDSSPAEREALEELFDVQQPVTEAETLTRKLNDSFIGTICLYTSQGEEAVVKKLIKGEQKAYMVPKALRGVIKNPELTIQYVNVKGESKTIYLTVNEAIKLYNQLAYDKGLWRGAEAGNGYTRAGSRLLKPDGTPGKLITDNTQAVLYAALEENDPINLQIAAGIMEHFNNTRRLLGEAYFDHTGVPMTWEGELERTYSGRGLRENFKNEELGDQFKAELFARARRDQQARETKRVSSMIGRTDSALPLARYSALNDVLGYNAALAHFKAYSEPSQIWAYLLNEPEILNILKTKYGQGTVDALHQHQKDLINGPLYARTFWTEIVNTALGNAATGLVAGRPGMIAKHGLQVVAATHYMSNKDLLEGIASYDANPARANKLLEQSDFWEGRYKTGVQEAVTGEVGDIHSLEKHTLKRFFLQPVSIGDRIAVRRIMWAGYLKGKKLGMTNERALQYAETIAINTQVSARDDMRSNLARNPNTRWLTIFKQQQMRSFERSVQDLHDALAHKSSDATIKALRTALISRAAQVLFVGFDAAVICVFGHDQKKKDKAVRNAYVEAIAGPLPPVVEGGVKTVANMAITGAVKMDNPSINSLFMTAGIGLEKDARFIETGNLPLDSVRDMKHMIEAMARYHTDVENHESANILEHDLLDATMNYGRSVNLYAGGYPISPLAGGAEMLLPEQEKRTGTGTSEFRK